MKAKANWGGSEGSCHTKMYTGWFRTTLLTASRRDSPKMREGFPFRVPWKSKYNVLPFPLPCSELKSQRGRETYLTHLLS